MKWHDMLRKSFDDYDQAVTALAEGHMMRMLSDMAKGILQRKLDTGFVLVSPMTLDYVKITPKHDWPIHDVKCVVEVVYVCEIGEITP